ncbi:MAG TPA: mannosyltransferase [Mycobacterium sp.]|nr:mannosyltransferase [Mycobacterium sp.]
MHAWLSWAGINEFTARLPSAVAVGAAAAGLVVLGKLVADRPTAWAAAIAFTAVPRTLWSAVEARSYALTAALAVWLTVVLVIAAARGSAALWALYSLVLALAVVVFVYLGLMVLAHAITLTLGRRRGHSARRLAAFALAVAAGLALASPLIALAAGQRQQLAWISSSDNNVLTGLLSEQWFTGSRLFIGASVVVLAGGVAALATGRARGAGMALAVAVPWIVVPTAVLAGSAAFSSGLYEPRYLTYTTPGLGLLLGVCMRAIAGDRSRILLVLLAGLVLSAGTAYVTQRGRYAKPGEADYSAIADVIAAHARPHDCVAFGFAGGKPLRAAAAARPAAFARLNDVAAGVPAASAAQLWTEDLPLDSVDVRPRLVACRVLWAVVARDTPSSLLDAAGQQGFVVDQRWTLSRDAVVRLDRR